MAPHEIEGPSSLIVIVARAGIGFPHGMAATARVHSYARGLKAAGKDVLVLCLGTSEPSPPEPTVNSDVRGTASGGIAFEYTCGSTVRSASFWRRRWTRAKGLLGAARRIRQQRAAGPVEAVLLYSDSFPEAAIMHFVSRSVGAVCIADVCEMPFHTQGAGLLRKLRRSVYNRTFFRWFDAVIAISGLLERHVIKYGSRRIAVLRAPVMVDTDTFTPSAQPVVAPPAIMYCGLLDEEKDGVVSLVRAFSGLANDMPDVRLILIGDTYEGSRIPEYRAVAEGLGVETRVVFVGRVRRSEVPEYLAGASVLVLARPSSPQADAGMPTKVAEYLATGAPVVVTRTGDIVEFLEDGVNAYLVPPDDVPALEEALRHVLLHPMEARAVGLRGREVAVRNFGYRVVGEHVASFIAELRAEVRRVEATERCVE
jgi:glycosyltransferase involved in cell wall biosynthesis